MVAGPLSPARAARQMKTTKMSMATRTYESFPLPPRRGTTVRSHPLVGQVSNLPSLPQSVASVRSESFRKRGLPSNILAHRGSSARPLVSQFTRDLQSRGLNQRGQLPQTGDCHPHHGCRDTQARTHASGVIPDGRGDASNVELVFLEIAGVAVFSDTVQFRFQLLKASHRVRRQVLQCQQRQNPFPLLIWHESQHDCAHRRAIQGNRGADARVNAQLLGRIQLLNVNRGQAMPQSQMNRFARLPVQFLKVRQAYLANIELAQSRLADREAGNSQVVQPIPSTVQKARVFQIHQKAMDRTYRESGAGRHLFCGQSMRGLAEKVKEA